jgi:hypothetical protein
MLSQSLAHQQEPRRLLSSDGGKLSAGCNAHEQNKLLKDAEFGLESFDSDAHLQNRFHKTCVIRLNNNCMHGHRARRKGEQGEEN